MSNFRYAVTHMNGEGRRQLTHEPFDTISQALKHLKAMLDNNSREQITELFRDSLEVRRVDCYDHGGAKSSFTGEVDWTMEPWKTLKKDTREDSE